MTSPDINVKVGAETEGLEKGMHQASTAVSDAIESMKNNTGALGFTIGAVSGVVQEFTHQVLERLGEGLKEATQHFNKLAREIEDFSNATGMGLRDASIMADTLNDLGIKTTQYEGVVNRISRALRSKDEAFERLGITVKDVSTGAMLPMQEILKNTLHGLEKFKEGTDRNMASMELLRMNWKDLAPFLRANEELMNENAEAAEHFGNIITSNDVEAMWSLKLAVADALKPMEAMWTVIGRALNPLMQEMAHILQGVLTAAFFVVTGAVKGLLTFFEALLTGIYVLTEPLVGMGRTIVIFFEGVGRAIGFLMDRDVKMAKASFTLTLREMEQNSKQTLENIKKHVAEATARVANMWGLGDSGDKEKKGTKDYIPKPSAAGKIEKSFTPEFDKAVEALAKAQQASELALLKEYLKEAKGIYDKAYKNNEISIREYYDAKNAIEQKGFEDSIALKEEEVVRIQEMQKRLQEKLGKAARGPESTDQRKEVARLQIEAIRLTTEELKATGELAVLQAQQAAGVLKNQAEMTDAEEKQYRRLQEIKNSAQQSLGLASLDQEKANLQQRYALREISLETMLHLERNIEQKRLAIQLEYLDKKKALANNDVVALEQINKDIERAEQESAARRLEIERQLQRDRMEAYVKVQESMQSSFASALSSIMEGHKKLRDVLKDFVNSVVQAINKIAAERIAKEVFAGSGGSGFLGGLFGAFGGMFAGGGGSSGGASAGAMKAATSGGSFSGLLSAASGAWELPSDQLVSAHKGESIVPAGPAAALRDFLSSGGKLGSGGGMVVNNKFNLSGPTDLRTQQQIATLSGLAVRRAMARNT